MLHLTPALQPAVQRLFVPEHGNPRARISEQALMFENIGMWLEIHYWFWVCRASG